MDKVNDYVNKGCTFISVVLLLHNATWNCIVNDIGILDSFLKDPLSYVATLLPVIVNLLWMLVKSIYDNFEPRLYAIYGVKSICVLVRIVIEFWIVNKYSLYASPHTGEEVSGWYRGVFCVIAVTVIEGIMMGILEGGMFDDLVDYLVDYLPYHCYLFCFILGMQEALNTYPDVLQSMNVATFFKLVLLASLLGILQGIKFVFEFCFLWIKL